MKVVSDIIMYTNDVLIQQEIGFTPYMEGLTTFT